MPTCESCGKSSDRLIKTNIEGCEMKACPDCSKLGSVVRELPKPKPVKKRFEEVVVSDAGKLIKAEREKRGMRQVDLAKMLLVKESLIHRIEIGLPVTLDLAKKIEDALEISLVEKEE